MKATLRTLATTFSITLMLSGCGPSGPSDEEVLNAWKERAAFRQKNGESALPLPPQAIVNDCKSDPNPPLDKGVFFMCHIRLMGKDDTNLNPMRVQRGPDGHWSAW